MNMSLLDEVDQRHLHEGILIRGSLRVNQP